MDNNGVHRTIGVSRMTQELPESTITVLFTDVVDRLMMIHNQPKRTAEELSDMAREIQRLSGIDVVVPLEAQVYDL
jgi:hypothetical protein